MAGHPAQLLQVEEPCMMGHSTICCLHSLLLAPGMKIPTESPPRHLVLQPGSFIHSFVRLLIRQTYIEYLPCAEPRHPVLAKTDRTPSLQS